MPPGAEWDSLPEKVMINIQNYGNTTAATIPLCIWEFEHKLKKGDNLILASFGGGFTWGSIWLKWAYDPQAGGIINREAASCLCAC